MPDITYDFQVVDVPNSETTTPSGINDSGVIVGTTDSGEEGGAGFYGELGNFTNVTYPGSIYTSATAINASGAIVGSYALGRERISLNGYSLTGSTFTDISVSAVTIPESINAAGDVTGTASSTGMDSFGYIQIAGQMMGPASIGTLLISSVTGINDSGAYVGNFTPYPTDGLIPVNPPDNYSNFAFEVSGGTTTIIDFPGSYATQVTGINNDGDIVGYYEAADGSQHGFVDDNDQYQTIDYPGTTDGTVVNGINDIGQIVGTDAQHVGFLATPEMPCYCRGTKLLTPRGEVAVEDLRLGDHLVTVSGTDRPIRWIGTRSYAGRFVAGNRDVLPVVISANALADGIPQRDLSVSPLHAMYLDGMLIPAAALVNGVSIRQMQAVERVEYFHVELETHDVILAEGAASETFVDDDSRGMFHNAAEYRALYPRAANEPARYFAPRVEGGAALETVFQRLLARSRPRVAMASARLLGNLESVDRERIIGWAHDGAKPVRLRILDNGIEIGRAVARGHRDDLRAAGIGNGRGGFDFIVPGGLSPLARHVIQVQRASDGRDLAQSPMVLETEQDMPAAHWSAAAAEGMDGYIDELTPHRISGWVRNIADPDRPVALQIRDNGVPIARVLANRYRPDLTRTKPGSGRYGFEVDIPGGLSPLARHVITFGREPDGLLLGGPPFVIEAADSFTPAVEQAIAAAVAAVRPGAEQARMLAFFTAQAERLRQSGADSEAHRAERQAGQRMRRREARAPRDPGLRALVIDERVPVAARDAGSQAMLSHMRALRRLGYAVSFAAAEETTAEFTYDGIVPCTAPFYSSVEDVLRRQAGCFDAVYLHRAEIAAFYLALARRCNPRARIIYSVADLHHVRLERQAAIEDRPELLAESRRLKLAEIVAACSANAVITHSSAEVGVLRHLVPQAAVHRVAWDVPVAATRTPFAARGGIAFIGAYSHAPNVDAAHFLVEAIMPLVWRRDPSIACRLIGTDMPKSVRRLARPGVVAVGAVADLDAEAFDAVRLTVAPLRYGAGVNGKVLASLAAGVPCVMSGVAAEGMALCPTLGGLVGTDAAAIAALICDLHSDRAANARVAKAGVAMIRRDFSVDAVDAALRRAIAGRGEERTAAGGEAAA